MDITQDQNGNFLNPAYVTPQQAAQLRAYSEQLQKGATAPTSTSLAGAIAQGLMGLSGAHQMNQANDQQRQLLEQGRQGNMQVASTNPVAAMLMGGGVPQAQQPPIQQAPMPQQQPQMLPQQHSAMPPQGSNPNDMPTGFPMPPGQNLTGPGSQITGIQYGPNTGNVPFNGSAQVPGAAPNQPPVQMAQNHAGADPNMAAFYMNPSIPAELKSSVMQGQVPQTITDAAGNMYLYKPGMERPVPLGLTAPGPTIKVPGYEGPINAGVGSSAGQPQGSPQGGGIPRDQGVQGMINWGINNNAAMESAKKEAEGTAGKLTEYKTYGPEAKQLLGNIDTLNQLGQKVGYGWGPQLQAWGASHGINTQGAGEVQAYQSFIPYVATLLRPEGSGRLMSQELSQFQSALGGLMTTPQGRAIAMDNLSRIGKYKSQIGDIANDTSLGPNQRMEKINGLPVPTLDWKSISAASGQPTGQSSASELATELARRGYKQQPNGSWSK